MPNKKFALPTYDEAEQRSYDQKATPIDIFIIENTPAGNEEEKKFREELESAIEFAIQNS